MTQEGEDRLLQKIFAELGAIAKADRKISYEELTLLKQVAYDTAQYQHVLDRAWKDGIITEKENYELTKTKNLILERAVEVTKVDDKISDDELILLKTLAKILKLQLDLDK